MFFKICIAVLTELFVKADTTGDGKVSLEEFMAICTEYGIQLYEEGEQELATVFGIYGEVNIKDIYTQRTVFMYLQMSKGDFISHIKKNNLARHFEVPDAESDKKWKNLAITAFRQDGLFFYF